MLDLSGIPSNVNLRSIHIRTIVAKEGLGQVEQKTGRIAGVEQERGLSGHGIPVGIKREIIIATGEQFLGKAELHIHIVLIDIVGFITSRRPAKSKDGPIQRRDVPIISTGQFHRRVKLGLLKENIGDTNVARLTTDGDVKIMLQRLKNGLSQGKCNHSFLLKEAQNIRIRLRRPPWSPPTCQDEKKNKNADGEKFWH